MSTTKQTASKFKDQIKKKQKSWNNKNLQIKTEP